MGDSGQTLALGLFIAMTGALYPFFAPILGWIGTYVTGSDTSANILFSGLQSGVGQEIGREQLPTSTSSRCARCSSVAAASVASSAR